MKLKKIASLALAGIMAVSMLAGCKDGTSQEEPSSSSQVPTTSNAVEYANYMLSGLEKDVFTFSSSATLNDALKAAAENVNKLTDDDIESMYGNVGGPFDQARDEMTDVYGELKDKLKSYAIVDNFVAAPGVSGDRITVTLYGLSGKLTEEEAVKTAVKYFVGTAAPVNTTSYPATYSGYTCDYTASVSALKVASRQHPDQSAWTVAVVVTQSSTVAV